MCGKTRSERLDMQEDIIKKIMPHSLEAEQSLLSSMLVNKNAINAATEIISGEDFYQHRNGLVFDAMAELAREGKAVDVVTLLNKLKEKDVPPEMADMEYIKELLGYSATSVNAKDYANIIAEKALLRRLIQAAEKLSNDCYQNSEPVSDIIEDAEKNLFALFQQKSYGELEPIRQVVINTLESIEEASKTKGGVTGIPTGFTDLDFKTTGFHNSDLIFIAARPSMGKTALALNMAEYMAFRKNKSVMIFSLEMSKTQLMNRLLAMESKVNSMNLRTGNLKDDEWTKLIDSAGVIGDSRLIIDDTPGISVPEMRSKCRKYKLEHGLDAIFIDYLQMMTASGRVESRQQEVSQISRSLKSLARELEVPIIVLSQLSRSPDQRADHRPMLADLRESGSIEQDADIVMFIYRDDYYNMDSEKKGIAEINIAKQRNGPIGTVELVWLPDFTKFMNLEK